MKSISLIREKTIYEDCIPMVDTSCVICMEILDTNNRVCVSHSKLLNTTCGCKYGIHKTCFGEWLKQRPTDDIRCLICASEGELVLGCLGKCRQRLPSYQRVCYVTYRGCCYACFLIVVWQVFFLILDCIDVSRDDNQEYKY